jgi:hypothetical protein
MGELKISFNSDVNKSSEKNEPSDILKKEDVDQVEEQAAEEEERKALEPKTRAPGGLWMEASDFPFCFQHLIIYYNPRGYTNKLLFKDHWDNTNDSYVSNENELYLLSKQEPDQEEGKEEEKEKDIHLIDEFKSLEKDEIDEKTKLLISFAPNGPQFIHDEMTPSFYFLFNDVLI